MLVESRSNPLLYDVPFIETLLDNKNRNEFTWPAIYPYWNKFQCYVTYISFVDVIHYYTFVKTNDSSAMVGYL